MIRRKIVGRFTYLEHNLKNCEIYKIDEDRSIINWINESGEICNTEYIKSDEEHIKMSQEYFEGMKLLNDRWIHYYPELEGHEKDMHFCLRLKCKQR